MSEVKHVLWTGGWDSTFRIIQLYNRGLILQPIYVIDYGRPSSKKEIETILALTDQIHHRFESSNGQILPLKFIKREDIPNDYYLKLIFKIIRLDKKKRIGKQYYWLACLSKKYNYLEQGFHNHEEEGLYLIYLNELTEIIDETGGRNWVANPKKMDFFRYQIFKNIRFPLMHISKLEMKQVAENEGFIDIMNLTWFCHRSDKKPCGFCNPCKQYVIDGLGYRLN